MTKDRQEKSESDTRRELVDPALRRVGWKILSHVAGMRLGDHSDCAITEYPTEAGPADYAFCADGRILGVVEAKKLSLGPQNVLTQSERYSRGLTDSLLNFDGFRAPFLYSTNGKVIWFHDVRHSLNRSRRVSHFHTPNALREMLEDDFDNACQRLVATPNCHPFLRPYQIQANTETEKAIAGRKRKMLLAMATGTGKTVTMVNQICRLMETGVAKRILFLVDRRALAAQGVRTMASFEAKPGLKFDKLFEVYSQKFFREDFADEPFDPKVLPASYLLDPKPGHAFVYVSTIQRMAVNLFGRNAIFGIGDEELDEDAEKLDIPIHAFDAVIADECHRGYTTKEVSVWRDTLDHFDAVKIGLTATPAAHTKAYFKDVVFRYPYDQAVREGYLVDYDVVAIHSDVRMKGVFLKEGEQVEVVDPGTGLEHMDVLEDERQFDASEVERRVTSPDSNRKIVEEIKQYALKHEQQTGRLPKTLMFAVNDLPHTSHADRLVDMCRDIFGRGDSFVQKITGRADRPLQRIREFRNRPEPIVVVSVDLMSTGVDIPDLEHIVFLRPVKSRILFEQMMGRGTRKGEKFPDKSHFTVFDCFGGTLIEYFRQCTGITAEPPEQISKTAVELIDDIWNNRDREYATRCLVKRLQRINKEMSAAAREGFAAFVPDGDLAGFARDLPDKLADDFTGTMKLLHDKDFQRLLQTFHRTRQDFLVAYETEDKVRSQYLIRDVFGNELKPDDYLEAFAACVKENASKIEAIAILLDRPAEWGTNALKELRANLTGSGRRFTVDSLQRAHEMQYHKALVDIISMVKHAAHEEAALLTAEERVQAAMARVSRGKAFSPEQQQWLDRIREHLVQNLSIERGDFEVVPVLARHGGWAPANRAFGLRLAEIIRQINEAIAA